MTTKSKQVLNKALSLPINDRVSIVDTLISSLDRPDSGIDALWRKESESRLGAYRKGHIKSVTLAHVLAKYKK